MNPGLIVFITFWIAIFICLVVGIIMIVERFKTSKKEKQE